MQTLDETAISGLSLAAELSNMLLNGVKSSDGTTQVSKAKFTWVLRDFVLEMRGQDGREMTENEYLESRMSNYSKSKNQRNTKVREALMKNFLNRELITIVRPVEDEKDIQKLHEKPIKALRQDFVKKL